MRYEHELQKKEEKERKKAAKEAALIDDGNASVASMTSYQNSIMSAADGYVSSEVERQPLVAQHQIV